MLWEAVLYPECGLRGSVPFEKAGYWNIYQDLSSSAVGIGTSDTSSTAESLTVPVVYNTSFIYQERERCIFGLIWKDLGHLNPRGLKIHKPRFSFRNHSYKGGQS